MSRPSVNFLLKYVLMNVKKLHTIIVIIVFTGLRAPVAPMCLTTKRCGAACDIRVVTIIHLIRPSARTMSLYGHLMRNHDTGTTKQDERGACNPRI